MGMEDFWEQLPTGKEDKPLLFEMGPLEYDFHDIDGLYFMLDRRLSGCLLMMWAKPMNPDIQGTVTLDSRVVSGCINQYMEVMGNMSLTWTVWRKSQKTCEMSLRIRLSSSCLSLMNQKSNRS